MNELNSEEIYEKNIIKNVVVKEFEIWDRVDHKFGYKKDDVVYNLEKYNFI